MKLSDYGNFSDANIEKFNQDYAKAYIKDPYSLGEFNWISRGLSLKTTRAKIKMQIDDYKRMSRNVQTMHIRHYKIIVPIMLDYLPRLLK